jgi:branched-subunit amino acid aminotransferase/4-amino-4-deoxychorismate lyase
MAAEAGLAAEERAVGTKDFAAMSECFLMSTTKDIVPVASIDETRFEVGPETATLRLKAAFGRYARRYAEEHRELRIF